MPVTLARNIDFSAVRGKRLLVALSGGADSVALIRLLSDARVEFDLSLYAAHVDHGIRPESASDAAFCETLCAELGIPIYIHRADVPALAAELHCGLETAAREIRHEWLGSLRAELGADYIVTAHHMDDQAETVLMRLARGTGLDGLGAMRAISGAYYRPLLNVHRAELREYLRDNGFAWREDATNAVDDNPRNAIRLHVIPELEKCYPQFVAAAARCAESAQIDSDCLEALTGDFLIRCGGAGPQITWIDLSEPTHRAVLRRALRRQCPTGDALSWAQVRALEALCAQRRGKIDLDGDCFAERTGNRLYFVRKRRPPVAPVPLDPAGSATLPGICVLTARDCAPEPVCDDPMIQVLDADALEGAVLRTRRDGDRFRPLGCGDRLLSDCLIDRKIDRPLRDAVAIVACGSRALWVCGLGISENAKITPDTRRALRLECRYTFDMRFGTHT